MYSIRKSNSGYFSHYNNNYGPGHVLHNQLVPNYLKVFLGCCFIFFSFPFTVYLCGHNTDEHGQKDQKPLLAVILLFISSIRSCLFVHTRLHFFDDHSSCNYFGQGTRYNLDRVFFYCIDFLCIITLRPISLKPFCTI